MEKINLYFEDKLFNIKTDLCQIMTECGSDKGNGWHNYTTLYNFIFNELKDKKDLNIFELGLGSTNPNIPNSMFNGKPCASLYGWVKYFNTNNVYGADIDNSIVDNVNTFYCNQTNIDDIKNLWENEILLDKEFDIIIDDGYHNRDANIIFLENSIFKVKNNGFYIIEDISNNEIQFFKNYSLNNKENYQYIDIITIPNTENNWDNNLLIIKK